MDGSCGITHHPTNRGNLSTTCMSEKRRQESSDWWAESIAASRGYTKRKTPNFRPELHRIRKELASRYYQLMMGHAIIAPYLKHKIKTSDSDTCWWCEKDVRQTREHLFKECSCWKDDIRFLWRHVERDVGPRWRRYKWKPISALFNERKATEAILVFFFLDRTGVGKKPRNRRLEEFDGEEPEM
jgi:hypothetical protein